MRGRLRKETHRVCVYKFRVYDSVRAVPESFFAVGREQQRVWNALVEMYRPFAIAKAAMDISDKPGVCGLCGDVMVEKQGKKSGRSYWQCPRLSEHRKDWWLKLEEASLPIFEASTLGWVGGPDLWTRFCAALKADREPKIQKEMDRLRIPHRYTGGGIHPSQLYSNRAWRVSLEAPPASAYSDNSQRNRLARIVYAQFGISAEEVWEFRLRIHRPFPEGTVVKAAALSGEFRPMHGWLWHLLFTCEIPFEAEKDWDDATRKDRTCIVRIGWSRLGENHVTVATLIDDKRRSVNLVTSLDMSNRDDIRAGAIIRDYRQLGELATKAREAEGLEYTMLRARYRSIWERWTARRRWLYRNFAAWLTRTYQTITIQELAVKDLAEEKNKAKRLHYSDKFRQWTAPGELQQCIREAALRRRNDLAAVTLEEAQKEDMKNISRDPAVEAFSPAWNSQQEVTT